MPHLMVGFGSIFFPGMGGRSVDEVCGSRCLGAFEVPGLRDCRRDLPSRVVADQTGPERVSSKTGRQHGHVLRCHKPDTSMTMA